MRDIYSPRCKRSEGESIYLRQEVSDRSLTHAANTRRAGLWSPCELRHSLIHKFRRYFTQTTQCTVSFRVNMSNGDLNQYYRHHRHNEDFRRGRCTHKHGFNFRHGKGKGKRGFVCIAPCREHTSKALRYGTRSQGISQFYLHTPAPEGC